MAKRKTKADRVKADAWTLGEARRVVLGAIEDWLEEMDEAALTRRVREMLDKHMNAMVLSALGIEIRYGTPEFKNGAVLGDKIKAAAEKVIAPFVDETVKATIDSIVSGKMRRAIVRGFKQSVTDTADGLAWHLGEKLCSEIVDKVVAEGFDDHA